MHFETNLPFSSITMENMRLKWVRDVGYNVDVYIFGQEFSSNFYEKESGYLIEKGFIGSLGKAEKHIVSDNNDRTYTFDLEKQIYKKYLNESGSGIHHNYIANKFEIENLNEIKAEFTLKVLMAPNGEKSIVIVLQDVKILAQTSVYMNLFYFAQLDESVYPVFEGKKTFNY